VCPIANSLSAHSVPRSLCSSIEKAHRKDLEASTGSLCLCKFYFTMRATAREKPLFPHALFMRNGGTTFFELELIFLLKPTLGRYYLNDLNSYKPWILGYIFNFR
jgi:hypothetical protein